MLAKPNINFNNAKIKTLYYKIEPMTDFEYMIILLANKSLDENKVFSKLLLEYTQGENDIYKLMSKRFKKLFSVNINEIKKVEKQVRESKNETAKLIHAEREVNLLYITDLELFLNNSNQLVTKEVILKDQEKKVKESQLEKFISCEIKIKPSELFKKFDVEINGKFNKFDFKNLKDQTNKKIIKNIIDYFIDYSNDKLPENNKVFSTIANLTQDYNSIERLYNNESIYTLVSELDDLEKDIMIELDNSGDKELIISEFKEYKKIPFVKEERIKFEDFREHILYKKFISKLSKNIKTKDVTLQHFSLDKFEKEEELKILRDKNLYQINNKVAFDKIEKMIDTNVNIINEEIFIQNEMYQHFINTSPVSYYKYLEKFEFIYILDKIDIHKKDILLYKIFNNDSTILSKEDNKYISNLIIDKRNIEKSIQREISEIYSIREEIREIREEIKSKMQEEHTLDNKELFNILQKAELDIGILISIANFFVHIKDKSTKFKRDIERAKNFDLNLISIKNKYLKENKENISNYDFNKDDLSNVINAKEKFLKECNDIKSIEKNI